MQLPGRWRSRFSIFQFQIDIEGVNTRKNREKTSDWNRSRGSGSPHHGKTRMKWKTNKKCQRPKGANSGNPSRAPYCCFRRGSGGGRTTSSTKVVSQFLEVIRLERVSKFFRNSSIVAWVHLQIMAHPENYGMKIKFPKKNFCAKTVR